MWLHKLVKALICHEYVKSNSFGIRYQCESLYVIETCDKFFTIEPGVYLKNYDMNLAEC